jgi:hypothetical protein
MFIPEASDELIRVDGLDGELAKDRRREIAQIERDNEASSAVNRRRQDVSVIDIGEGQRRDEGLVFGDEAIGDVLVHELALSSETRGRDIRPIGQDVSRPLIMNLVRPTRLEQVREGKLHEQVAERGRVKDACIVEYDWGHRLVAHIELLAQRREFFEGGLTPGLKIPLVGE